MEEGRPDAAARAHGASKHVQPRKSVARFSKAEEARAFVEGFNAFANGGVRAALTGHAARPRRSEERRL